jgi:hypothetical protein
LSIARITASKSAFGTLRDSAIRPLYARRRSFWCYENPIPKS